MSDRYALAMPWRMAKRTSPGRWSTPSLCMMRLRYVSTLAAEIASLAATAKVAPHELESLRAALLSVGERAELLLRGFAAPATADYDDLQPWTGKDLP